MESQPIPNHIQNTPEVKKLNQSDQNLGARESMMAKTEKHVRYEEGGIEMMSRSNLGPRQKKKRWLHPKYNRCFFDLKDEIKWEFVEYKIINKDGVKKKVRTMKRTRKIVKTLTEE